MFRRDRIPTDIENSVMVTCQMNFKGLHAFMGLLTVAPKVRRHMFDSNGSVISRDNGAETKKKRTGY